MRAALEATLEPSVQLTVAHAAGTAEAKAAALQVPGAVAIVWPPNAATAQARISVRRDGQWIERQVDFRPTDAVVERGRAVGFVLSAMLPELRRDFSAKATPTPTAAPPSRAAPPPPEHAARPSPMHREPPAAAPSPPTAPSVPPPAAKTDPSPIAAAPPPAPTPPQPASEPEPANPPANSAPTESAAAPPPDQRVPAPATPPTATPAPPTQLAEQSPTPSQRSGLRIGVELSALGTWELGHSTPNGGGRLTVTLGSERIAARVGGWLAAGWVSGAQANLLQVAPFAGVSVCVLPTRLSVWLRADLGASSLSVTRGAQTQARWRFFAQPMAELDYHVAQGLTVMLAVGADVGPSATRLVVDGAPVAELGQVGAVADFGLKWRW